MAQKKNYQYTVWVRDGKDHDKDRLVKDITAVVASSEEHVKNMAIRSLTEQEVGDDLEKLEVIVRPF